MYTNPYQVHRSESIIAADPMELVVLLAGEALESTIAAERCVKAGDIPGRSRHSSRAMELIAELAASLNPEAGGEISVRLAQLYQYCLDQLREGNFKNTTAPFRNAQSVLAVLVDAWRQCQMQLAAERSAPVSLASSAECSHLSCSA